MGGIRLHRRSSFNLVHARTFVGGLCGSGIARLTRTALIYHNEGFYPDEQVDGGVWRAGSAPHRLARWLERRLYASAEGVVTLSRKAETIVRGLPDVEGSAKPIVVVPSCVDLVRFALAGPRQPPEGRPLRFVYAGSIGGRYLFEHIARFFALGLRRLPGSRLTVLSWADPGAIRDALRAVGVPDSSWVLRTVAHHDMPRELAAHDAGLHFATAASGGAGGSPTKVGEYWACGLPVVVTSGLGDIGELVTAERTGVVVDDLSETGLLSALRRLDQLLRDPSLPGRCRAAAERHYNLDVACDTQVALYRTLLDRGR
jgi:glycosyltransferase involved in cell wall biosynthesis